MACTGNHIDRLTCTLLLIWVRARARESMHIGRSGNGPAHYKVHPMQFQLSSGQVNADTVASVLNPMDPDAQITLDPDGDVLEVISTISTNQIIAALGEVGCEVKLLDDMVHVSGGSTCCGGCS